MPLVSVIIPTYNSAQYIGAALDSIFRQTFSDYEIIVVDDGSTDDTYERLEPYLSRIIYIYQENQERSAARNHGINKSCGNYITFLDADDLWLPTYLQKQVANLEENPGLGFSHTWAYGIDVTGLVVQEVQSGVSSSASFQEFQTQILLANQLKSCAVMVRRDCLDKVGLFDPQLRQAEDWDLWIRLALKYPGATVQDFLACYRLYNSFLPQRMVARGLPDAYPYIVEKTFSLVDKNSDFYTLKPIALRNAYWRSAWALFVVGEFSRGRDCLEKARASDPEFFSFPYQTLIESIGYLSDEIYDIYTPLDEALKYTNQFFRHIPKWLSSKSLERCVKGQVAGVNFFRNYQRGDWKAVRRAGLLALFYKPDWLKNRGFCTILVKALLWPNPITGNKRVTI